MAFVLDSLRTVYWAGRRPPGLTERSWAHSLAFGAYAPGGTMAGFCRVVTDFTFRAHLGDVFISPAARGAGLGKALVAAVLGHPELATVAKWTLTTADAHGLYAQFGFSLLEGDGKLMVLERRAAAGW